jgi:hypothetical protein
MKLFRRFSMGFFDPIVDFGPLLKLPEGNPFKLSVEKQIIAYVKERWNKDIFKQESVLDVTKATIEEIRGEATKLFQEADRLVALPDRKQVYVIRKGTEGQMLFADTEEDKTRYWALQNPSDENLLFKETWVKDPQIEDRFRTLERFLVDCPTVTAKKGASK